MFAASLRIEQLVDEGFIQVLQFQAHDVQMIALEFFLQCVAVLLVQRCRVVHVGVKGCRVGHRAIQLFNISFTSGKGNEQLKSNDKDNQPTYQRYTAPAYIIYLFTSMFTT